VRGAFLKITYTHLLELVGLVTQESASGLLDNLSLVARSRHLDENLALISLEHYNNNNKNSRSAIVEWCIVSFVIIIIIFSLCIFAVVVYKIVQYCQNSNCGQCY